MNTNTQWGVDKYQSQNYTYRNPQDPWSSDHNVPLSHEPQTRDGLYDFVHLQISAYAREHNTGRTVIYTARM